MLIDRHERGEPTQILDEMVSPCSAAQAYWEAFHELSDQREMGFGSAGPIRLEAIYSWLDEHWVKDPMDRNRYCYFMRAIDREYLRDSAKKRDAKPKGEATGASSRPHRPLSR